MSNLVFLAKIQTAIILFYDDIDTIITAKKAVEGVGGRKKSIPQPKEVQNILDHNARLEKKLNLIANSGIPDPAEPNTDPEDPLNPSIFSEQLEIRTKHQNSINKCISDFINLAREASIRSRAAYDISQFFRKATVYLPDVLGTVNRHDYFNLSQVFQSLSASLNRVAKAARLAKKCIEDDLKDYSGDTDRRRHNLRTLGLLRG